MKEGDLLFEIDPRPYQAQLDQAQGQVELNEACYKLVQSIYVSDLSIVGSGAVSRQQVNQDKAAAEEAAAGRSRKAA